MEVCFGVSLRMACLGQRHDRWSVGIGLAVSLEVSPWVHSRSLRSPGRLARLHDAPGPRPASGYGLRGYPWHGTKNCSQRPALTLQHPPM